MYTKFISLMYYVCMGKVVTIVTIKLICPSQIVYFTDYL